MFVREGETWITTRYEPPTRIDYDGHAVDGYRIEMQPFVKDANRDKLRAFADARYVFLVAEAIPGGIYSIEETAPGAGGKAAVTKTLKLVEVKATP